MLKSIVPKGSRGAIDFKERFRVHYQYENDDDYDDDDIDVDDEDDVDDDDDDYYDDDDDMIIWNFKIQDWFPILNLKI
jgi:hypothetical protein